MNGKEQQRAMVLNQLERKALTGQEKAVLVGLSLRQARRHLAGDQREGVEPWPAHARLRDHVCDTDV